jgi:hypothetical protein
MSSSFKYLDKSSPSTSFGSQKAQEFLNEKLSKNRFTQNQQETLDANGGPTVANASEGFQKKADDAANAVEAADNGFVIKGSGSNDDPMYSSGKWGKGSMTPEQIAEKFGLDRSNATNPDGGNKDGDIWGTDASGNKVYIGTVKDQGSLMGNSELVSAHSRQRHEDEGDHESLGEELSSSGDLNGALLNLWDGSGGEIKEAKAEPEKEEIEHSPEIKQAKERVRAYEDDVLSGKTSEDIYGGNPSDKYKLDLNKGADGIGTFIPDTSEQATASFLDNKKSQIKDKYQFKRAQ